MTLEEFVAEAKRQGKSQEEVIAKAEELQASGFFNTPPATAPQKDKLSTAETIQGAGQKVLDGLFFGMGDEISGAGRALADTLTTGSNFFDNYETYVEDSRRTEAQFSDENKGLSMGLEIGSSLLPAAKISMAVGNAATRLGNIGRQAGAGAAEMAVREVGEGEGGLAARMAQVDPLVVGFGALAGAGGGALMRGQRNIDAMTAAELKNPGAIRGMAENIRDDVYTVAKREIGEEPARKMVTADARSTRWKQKLHNEDVLPLKKLDALTKELGKNGKVAKMLGDVNATVLDQNGKYVAKFSTAARKGRLQASVAELRKTNPEAADTLDRMLTMTETIQQQMRDIFPGAAKQMEEGYFPLYAKPVRGKKRIRDSSLAGTDASTQARQTGLISEKQALEVFDNPVHNFMTYFEDTIDAIALARTYGVKSNTKTLSSIRSYTDDIVKSIREKAVKEGTSEEQANALASYLRLYTIDGRTGMSPWMTAMRTISHSALLGTPENALLQVGDLGQAAYATSFTDSIKALPKALKSLFLTNGDMVVGKGRLGVDVSDTVRMADLGLTRQHLTEMINESRTVWGKNINKTAEILMKASGVKGANRLGVETNLNAQLGQLRSLAKQGKEALRKSVYAEGLDEKALDNLYTGIQSGNAKDPDVLDAIFFRLGRFQPVSRTAMPPAYLAAKNGRILWSMKMYMVKMASRFDEDVLQPAVQAERLGINTDAGREMLGKSARNASKYAGFIVALNSFVDPGRKELLRGKESDNTYAQEFARQTASFATGAIVDPNMVDYGGLEEGLIPPAIGAAYAPINLGIKYLKEGDVTPAQVERAAMFVPGVRQLLWTRDVIEANE
jgi:hypothetical protein